jgi:hypothetical protein
LIEPRKANCREPREARRRAAVATWRGPDEGVVARTEPGDHQRKSSPLKEQKAVHARSGPRRPPWRCLPSGGGWPLWGRLCDDALMTTWTPPPPSARWTADEDDARLAWKLQAVAPIVVLAVGWLATSSGGLSAALSRIFLGMWIHELGHAVTAWFTGFFAFPGPWRTIVGDERSWSVRIVVGGLLVALVVLGMRHQRRWWTAMGSVLLAVFVLGAFVIPASTARMCFSFGGDAGNLIIGPVLMLVGHLPADHAIKRRWLHWGFLVIGAFAFCDVAHQWARAARDAAEIPFGRIDGVGLSDASVLVERYGWSEQALVSRYTRLAWLGLAGFLAGHGVFCWLAWRALPRSTSNDAVPDAPHAPDTSPAAMPAMVVRPRRPPREPIDL